MNKNKAKKTAILQMLLPLLLFFCIYSSWWIYLERKTGLHYTNIHLALDDLIPFSEIFVIPYYIWFLYFIGLILYFLLTLKKKDYYRYFIFLASGMTLFLIISTLFPNIQHLRPSSMPRNNFLTKMVLGIYASDTPTNLWPSIHCYNSIGAHLAVSECEALQGKKGVQTGSFLLALSIVFSTVFIKQHSVFDVITACLFALVMYALIYRGGRLLLFARRLYRKAIKKGRS